MRKEVKYGLVAAPVVLIGFWYFFLRVGDKPKDVPLTPNTLADASTSSVSKSAPTAGGQRSSPTSPSVNPVNKRAVGTEPARRELPKQEPPKQELAKSEPRAERPTSWSGPRSATAEPPAAPPSSAVNPSSAGPTGPVGTRHESPPTPKPADEQRNEQPKPATEGPAASKDLSADAKALKEILDRQTVGQDDVERRAGGKGTGTPAEGGLASSGKPAAKSGNETSESTAGGRAGQAAADPPAPARPATGATRTHRVERGDTLALISEHYYDSQRYTDALLAANPQITNKEVIHVGMVLNVPPLDQLVAGQRSGKSAADKASTGGSTVEKAGDAKPLVNGVSTGGALPGTPRGDGQSPASAELAAKARGGSVEEKKASTSKTPKAEDARAKTEKEKAASDNKTTKAGDSIAHRPADGAGTYTVKSGDTFFAIAARQLGAGSRWREVYELNKAEVDGQPSNLRAGMVLKLPK